MAEKLYYSMGEVAEMFDVRPSLLRHWESQFAVLRPKRNKKGNRLFTPQDVENLKLIYHLVKERGMTLDGARKALRSRRADKGVSRDAELMERLQRIRALLLEVREDLKADEGEVVAVADDFAAEEPSVTPVAAETPVPSEPVAAEVPAETAGERATEPSPAGSVPEDDGPVVENAGAEPAAEVAGADTETGAAPGSETPALEAMASGGPVADGPASDAPATAAPAAERPAAPRRRKAVVKIVEEADGETPAAETADGVAPARRPARRPRRGRKEDAENKELFAFYEQSLF